MSAPRVWIACLAAYNDGCLHGEWVDASSVEALEKGRRRVLASSPIPGAEEAAIHDYDGFPAGLASALGEYPDFAVLGTVGSILTDLGETEGEAFAAWLANEHHDRLKPDLDTSEFREAYEGTFESFEKFADDLFEQHETATKKDIALNYFFSGGSQGWIRDLELSGAYWTHDGHHGVHVFRGDV
jgi:antirestriction protein